VKRRTEGHVKQGDGEIVKRISPERQGDCARVNCEKHIVSILHQYVKEKTDYQSAQVTKRLPVLQEGRKQVSEVSVDDQGQQGIPQKHFQQPQAPAGRMYQR
jgi:hypothetical protein